MDNETEGFNINAYMRYAAAPAHHKTGTRLKSTKENKSGTTKTDMASVPPPVNSEVKAAGMTWAQLKKSATGKPSPLEERYLSPKFGLKELKGISQLAILITLAVLTRRSRPNPCGHYIPGLVVPMRFLDGYEHRWSHALSFGAITGIILNVIFDVMSGSSDQFYCPSFNSSVDANSTNICDNTWVRTLILHWQSLLASLVCAPHFVCITTSHRLVGALMGMAYGAYWVVIYIVGAVKTERYFGRKTGTLLLLRDLPVILCTVGLVVRSVYTILKCYTTKRIRDESVEKLVEPHQLDHVTSLFRPPPPASDEQEGYIEKMKVKAKAQLFPHFKLPTRIICIAFMQIIAIYYLGLTDITLYYLLRRWLGTLTTNFNASSSHTLFAMADGVYGTSSVIGFLSSLAYVALFVINYRRNMINIYKGYKHLYVSNSSDISPSRHVASSLRLPGYQIAYTLWGFIIIVFMVLVTIGIIVFGIYFLNASGLLLNVLLSVLQTLSIPLITVAFFYLQVLVVRRFLLQPKINQKDKFHPLNVDNRHVYELVAYTMMFFNLLVGIGSALSRTLKSLLLGLIFLARLDRCLLMKGAEALDPGYMAYVNTLLVDNAHNHPVMRTFCAVLVRLTCTTDAKIHKGIPDLLEPAKTGSNTRAVRRWHLAYTLLKNPDLLPRRKLALLLVQGANNDSNNDLDDKDANVEDDSASAVSSRSKRLEEVRVQSCAQKKGRGRSEISLHNVLSDC